MTYILTDADYPAIRSVIDTMLTRNDLPDDVIGQDVFMGAAQTELFSRVPDAALKTGEEAERVRRALILLTAAQIVPSAIRIVSQTVNVSGRDMTWMRETFDPEKKMAELRARAEQEIYGLKEPGNRTPGRYQVFRVAPGGRGR